VFFVWTDQLDTPRVISDDQNRIRWEWDANDPFGNNAPNEDPSGVGAFSYNLRFPGQYFDAETGLRYNYFRDYDPAIGRYVESDPIGLEGGSSTFGYVEGNPLVYSDEQGKFINIAIGAVTGVLTGYAIAKLTGDECYGWKDALEDAAFGAAGAGIVSKLTKLYRIAKLRRLAESRGLRNLGRQGYTETWKAPDSLETLDIKFRGGKSPNLHPDSKVPRFAYRIEAGKYLDPFTGRTGPGKSPVAHVPLEPPIPYLAGTAGALSAGAMEAACGCTK
jgi:RHS repeat-associated protein